MVLHPAVQEKAQAQLDSVIGMNRLPDFDDISSLPYIEAVLMEIMRWRPVVPLSTYSTHNVLHNELSVLK